MKALEIFEVNVIGNEPDSHLEDSDTVRVYHGTSSPNNVAVFLTKGLSGGSAADRLYSYEANNNPKGLFVTPDLRVAKEFGDYVIEFQTRVRDLEAPVWPGGMFTVQGGMSGTFDSEADREAERLRQRMRWSEDELEYVRNSDRPELAALFLTGGERQALFTGDLNPNSIRAVWASPDPTRVGQTYVRMRPREFMKLADTNEVPTRFGSKGGLDRESELFRKSEQKIVSPRDNVTAEMLIGLLSKKFKIEADYVRDLFKKDPQMIRDYVWSDTQFNNVMNDIRNMT